MHDPGCELPRKPQRVEKTSPDESVRWSIDAIVGSMTFSRTCPRRRMSHYDGDQDPLLPPLTDLSLEELVPKDNFYRHLDRKLDLSFVRDVKSAKLLL
jgi:hypothetical protein